MRKRQKKKNSKLRIRVPVPPPGGPHKDKRKYDRKKKHPNKEEY